MLRVIGGPTLISLYIQIRRTINYVCSGRSAVPYAIFAPASRFRQRHQHFSSILHWTVCGPRVLLVLPCPLQFSYTGRSAVLGVTYLDSYPSLPRKTTIWTTTKSILTPPFNLTLRPLNWACLKELTPNCQPTPHHEKPRILPLLRHISRASTWLLKQSWHLTVKTHTQVKLRTKNTRENWRPLITIERPL